MINNNEELFPLVDEEGNVTGSATRQTCHNGCKLLHPVVHLHVFNESGELFCKSDLCTKTFSRANGILP